MLFRSNTGNFHWPTEDITAAYFLNKIATPSSSSSLGSKSTVLCELGAGCGLASFAIANALNTLASSPHTADSTTTLDTPTNKHLIVATDGNSRVVHTLKRNVKKLYNNNSNDDGCGVVSVTAAKLPWQCPTLSRSTHGCRTRLSETTIKRSSRFSAPIVCSLRASISS